METDNPFAGLTTLRDLFDRSTDRNPSWLEQFRADQILAALLSARMRCGIPYEHVTMQTLDAIEQAAQAMLLEGQP